MTTTVVRETSFPGLSLRRGKVRDVYDLGDRLLLISTDRLSAFDWVLPTGIPDKGRVLTQISAFWFNRLGVPNHMLTTDVERMDLPLQIDRKMLTGRTMLCRKAEVVSIECVVRGYLAGSGWSEYRKSGTVCGISLPAGLSESAGCRNRSSRRPPRNRPDTTKTFPSSGWSKSQDANWPKNSVVSAWKFFNAAPHTPCSGELLSPTRNSSSA